MDINDYKVISAPPTVYYIPNFITPDEEAQIIKNVYAVPKPKWTCLSNRRLQDYGGVPHEKGMIPEKIPAWLQTYLNKVNALNIFDGKLANQALINEYLPNQGIMPHTDGPLFYPTITTISCGSHTILRFLENNEQRQPVCELLLEQCSLVIVKDEMYTNYLHSIEEKDSDVVGDGCANLTNCGKEYAGGDILTRDTRVSVTIRNVPKVLKIKIW